MKGFPTRAPIELEDRPPEQQWLVDTPWGEQAVGIVGGTPRCGKSILALDLAVAVAVGVPCLRRFASARPEAPGLRAISAGRRVVIAFSVDDDAKEVLIHCVSYSGDWASPNRGRIV